MFSRYQLIHKAGIKVEISEERGQSKTCEVLHDWPRQELRVHFCHVFCLFAPGIECGALVHGNTPNIHVIRRSAAIRVFERNGEKTFDAGSTFSVSRTVSAYIASMASTNRSCRTDTAVQPAGTAVVRSQSTFWANVRVKVAAVAARVKYENKNVAIAPTYDCAVPSQAVPPRYRKHWLICHR